MYIILKSRNRPFKVKMQKEFFWYDPYEQKMFHGLGSEMRFKYENGRMNAYTVSNDSTIQKNDYDEILKWIKINNHRIDIVDEIKKQHVVIEVSDNDSDQIAHDLRKNNILFEESETSDFY